MKHLQYIITLMSRFGPVRCYECGSCLDDKYEAFSYMRSVLNTTATPQVHIDKTVFDTTKEDNFEVIFDVLRIRREKHCCRTRLSTTVLPKDLETRGTQWTSS